MVAALPALSDPLRTINWLPDAARSSLRPSSAIKKAARRGRLFVLRRSRLFPRLLDAFAEREADEARNGDRRADRLFGLLDGLGDALRRIMDVRLIEETHFLVE